MTAAFAAPDNNSHWKIEEIDFARIEKAQVKHDHFLFQTLASASFVEILSDTYADNLIQYFDGNSAMTNWLEFHWKRDEVQHGASLKAYVNTVWPEFDWDSAYRAFNAEYGVLCTVENLEKNKPLELMARCVVETGTSSFYRALQDYVHEPVLKALLGRIRNDETAHYGHFRRAFDLYNLDDPQSFGAIVATIFRRLTAIGGEDAFIAFKHTQSNRDDDALYKSWQQYHRQLRRLAIQHYPYTAAVKMLLKPVPLIRPCKAVLQWPLIGVAYLFSLT